MRKSSFLVILLMLSISISNSQDNRSENSQNSGFFLNVNGGISLPLGQLSSGTTYIAFDPYINHSYVHVDWGLGWNAGGEVGYVFNNNIGTRVCFSYSKFPAKDITLQSIALTGATGGSLSIFALGGDFMIGNFKKNSKIVRYGFLGPRAFFKSAEDATYLGHKIKMFHSETEGGLSMGAGMNFNAAKRLGFSVESELNLGFGNHVVTQTLVLKAGVVFNF